MDEQQNLNDRLKNMAAEYWRENANSWLEIADKQDDAVVRLFACKCAEDSLNRMDLAKAGIVAL